MEVMHSLESRKYRYQALPDSQAIRLLRLHPGQPDDPLRGDLVFANLKDTPTYKAISYAWGKLTRCAVITCNGHSLELTQSLHDALRRVRHISGQQLIWADQISINQADPKERSQQVMLMNKIYKNANQVLVWLGCDEVKIAKSVFDLIKLLERKFRDKEKVDRITAHQREELYWISEDLWRNVAQLYNLPWVSFD
jgi:hypothetical protein